MHTSVVIFVLLYACVTTATDVNCYPLLNFSAQESSSVVAVHVPESVQVTVKEQLAAYRMNLMSHTHATALVGIEMCTGLTNQAIANIATNCSCIHSENDVLKFGVTSRVYCSSVFDIVNNFTKVMNGLIIIMQYIFKFILT